MSRDQIMSQDSDRSGLVSTVGPFRLYLTFQLRFRPQAMPMINYLTLGGMRYIKRKQRILYFRIIRLLTFNQFIDKIVALPFDRT